MKIIHLSDLHLRDGWFESQGHVVGAFLEDISTYVVPGDGSILVFSGDLVQSGADSRLYQDFLEKFDKLFTLFPDKSLRVCCAGNHDGDRKYVEENISILKPVYQTKIGEFEFNSEIHKSLSGLVLPKFTNFDLFQNENFGLIATGANFTGRGYEIGNVGIYVANSSLYTFCGAKEVSDKGNLPIDTRRLSEWIHTNTSKHRILVMHHPLDWLTPWAERELRQLISKYFSFFLSGHTHEAEPAQLNTAIGESVQFSAPALFESKSSPNGYTVIDLNADTGTIKTYYRKWSQSTLNFVAGTDIVGNDTGVLTFIKRDPGGGQPAVSVRDKRSLVGERLDARLNESLQAYTSLGTGWVEPVSPLNRNIKLTPLRRRQSQPWLSLRQVLW